MAGSVASLIVGSGAIVRNLVTGLVGTVMGSGLLYALGVVLPFPDLPTVDVVTATIGAAISVVATCAIA